MKFFLTLKQKPPQLSFHIKVRHVDSKIQQYLVVIWINPENFYCQDVRHLSSFHFCFRLFFYFLFVNKMKEIPQTHTVFSNEEFYLRSVGLLVIQKDIFYCDAVLFALIIHWIPKRKKIIFFLYEIFVLFCQKKLWIMFVKKLIKV